MILSTTINGHHIDFQGKNPIRLPDGLTIISGPNRKGKSTILEVGIRYALFGVDALRLPAKFYKGLSVTTDFVVRGQQYTVQRDPKVVLLKRNGEPVATGVTAVNKAILRLFGYGLSTFDIVNCCNQGEVLAFSTLKPSERKQMIDQILGLSAIDQLLTELSSELTASNATLKGLQSAMGPEPIKPETPTWYEGSEKVKQQLEVERERERQYLNLTAIINQPFPQPADWSEMLKIPRVEEGLEELESLRQEAQAQAQGVYALRQHPIPQAPQPPEALVSPPALEALEQSLEARSEATRLLKEVDHLTTPEYTLDQLSAMQEQWELIQQWNQKQTLLNKGEIDCPVCHHSFPLAYQEIEHACSEAPAVRPDDPVLSPSQINVQLNRWAYDVPRQTELMARLDELRPLWIDDDREWLTKVKKHEADLQVYQHLQQRYESAQAAYQAAQSKLQEILATCQVEPAERVAELSEKIHCKRQYLQLEASLQDREAFFKEAQARKTLATAELHKLAFNPDHFRALHNRYRLDLEFETELNLYGRLLTAWQANNQKLIDEQATLDDVTQARKALMEFKSKVKGYILPSLNKVASAFLTQMTGGELYSCGLTDTYEVYVNGQPLAAESGAGKAMGNIALRLALGQCLTNRVFSVFLGDELDASMDVRNATHLMDALHSLKGHIKQLIVVSHKQGLVGDHYIQF